ncbi:hypothetical protein PF004_g24043 [Phytophthora fragariae]|uniref:Retrotransposon gag domain-containing protein n=1 Tax=Phytophthora fragariae TaxID=53985 RepID=A0A6G0MVC3_9STRA|nr:hypothetical protein PF004_g24043 [Phytophthora fragariae]
MRGHYDETYAIRFAAESGECDMSDGEGRWFEEGTGDDDFIEDGDHEFGLMMEAEYNMLKLIPYFDSENACSESAKDFWWCFETATEGFDDEIRLRMFVARMSGKVGERWCLCSRLTDFKTLKRRFYNRFIRLTKEQWVQRLLDAAQEHDELVDDWGRRISRYCDEARLLKETLRYRVFVNGLRSDRLRRFLDWLPVHSIEVACGSVVAKGFHRPEREDCWVEPRARRYEQEVSRNCARTGGGGIHGELEEDGLAARIYGQVEMVRDIQLKTQRRTEELTEYGHRVRSSTVRVDGDAKFEGWCGSAIVDGCGESYRDDRMQECPGVVGTEDIESEPRWNGESAEVEAEAEWTVKVTERNGGHVDEVPVKLSWNGQVKDQHEFDETEDAPEEELCSVTRDHEKTVYCTEASLGALVEGTPVEDGAVCEEQGRTVSTADERECVGAATTGVQDQGNVSGAEVGTVDAECFDTVVIVIPCQKFPESCEEHAEWATVSYASFEKKTTVCRDYNAVTARCSVLVSRCEMENRSSKDGWVPVEAVPVIERWCGVPPERDKLVRVW